METYKVRIYPTAKQDMREIVQYLNTLSQESALANYDLLVEKIAGLAQMPSAVPSSMTLRCGQRDIGICSSKTIWFFSWSQAIPSRSGAYYMREGTTAHCCDAVLCLAT